MSALEVEDNNDNFFGNYTATAAEEDVEVDNQHEEAEEATETSTSTKQNTEEAYQHRKPRWWRTRSRRKGSKAQRQALQELVAANYTLPRVPYGDYLNWDEVFPSLSSTTAKDIWLEIGFGSGDNLLRLAEQYANDVHVVGAEIHKPGIGTVAQRIQQANQQRAYWKGYTSYSKRIDPDCTDDVTDKYASDDNMVSNGTDCQSPKGARSLYSNLKIHQGSGIKLLSFLPSHRLTAILVTNPDPFPREDQKEWRLIQRATVIEMHRVLTPSRGCLYLATDHEGFFAWSQQVLEQVSDLFEVVYPCPSRHLWLPVVSAYEKRGWDHGRKTMLACWRALPSSH